jgi:hypothetical protein
MTNADWMAERAGFELAVLFATDSAVLPVKFAFRESKPTRERYKEKMARLKCLEIEPAVEFEWVATVAICFLERLP